MKRAYFGDSVLWFYLFLTLYKFFYRTILMDSSDEISWMSMAVFGGISLLVALLMFKIPHASVFKVYLGLDDSRWSTSLWGGIIVITVVATFMAALYVTKFSFYEFFSPDGLMGAKRMFGDLINPNFAIFSSVLFSAVETIYMAFIATVLAIPAAFVVSFFAARNLMKDSFLGVLVYYLIRFFMNITRAIEPIVWAIIFSVWVGIGPFAGMLALWLHSISALTKLYSEQIENIDNGPVEAILSTGANVIQVVWFGVVPQVVLPFLSYTIYRWDINVRMATVIGMVGGGGIGTLLMQYQGLAKWREVGLIAIIIAIIVWAMDYASSKIRERIK